MDCVSVGTGRTTRDLDVCVDAVVGTRRKSLEFAEIRRRLQDAEVELEASPECAKESPRTSRSMVGAGDAA